MSPPSLRHPARLAGASLLRLQSDERLAGLAAASHEAAFDAIVDRYRAPLTRYCAGIVGPSRAEDAVQQTLINAHDALKRTDEVRHLRSWLYRIAHNAALNVLRAVRDDVSLDAASGPAVAVDDGPAAAFERSERFRATVNALQELPERQRAALVLRELEGRSHEEIAEALGVTKGSARQHLLRARVAVRTAVTAITPYPLIVRLAEMLTSPGAAGWTDAAVGAGAGATLAKLTAGVAVTGALVGGAVGTERVVHHRDSAPKAAERSAGGAAPAPRPVKARVVSLPAAGAAGSGSPATEAARDSSGDRAKGENKRERDDRGDGHARGRDGSGGRSPGGSGHDDASADSGRGNGSHGRGDRAGATSGSGHETGERDGSDDRGRRGRSGSGPKDSESSKRDSSGRGSSRSGGDDGDRSSGTGSSGSSGTSAGETSPSGPTRSHDDSSGSGSGRGSDESADTPVAEPTPTVATPPPTTTTSSGSDDDSRSGRDDDSGPPDHSGSG